MLIFFVLLALSSGTLAIDATTEPTTTTTPSSIPASTVTPSPAGLEPIPFLAQLARSLPTFRSSDDPSHSQEAVRAIEEFTGPLVRFATGGQPVAADVEQLIDSIPRLAKSASALKVDSNQESIASVDISALPPAVVAHVLNGGEIPGIDRAQLDQLVNAQLKRMAEAAGKALKGETIEDQDKVLPPLAKLPTEIIMSSIQGKPLPGLNATETALIREYYTKQLPLGLKEGDETPTSSLPESLAAIGAVLKMLPPGYDISRIPPQILESISRGEVPDLTLLPQDLQDHIASKASHTVHDFVRSVNSSVSELVKRLSPHEVEEKASYDIAKVTHEVIDDEAVRDHTYRMRLYTLIWLAIVLVISTIVISCILYRKYGSAGRKPNPAARTPLPRDEQLVSPQNTVAPITVPPPVFTSSPVGTESDTVARRRVRSPELQLETTLQSEIPDDE